MDGGCHFSGPEGAPPLLLLSPKAPKYLPTHTETTPIQGTTVRNIRYKVSNVALLSMAADQWSSAIIAHPYKIPYDEEFNPVKGPAVERPGLHLLFQCDFCDQICKVGTRGRRPHLTLDSELCGRVCVTDVASPQKYFLVK